MRQLKLEYIDTSIQTRYRLDQGTISDYENAMRNGAAFPPLVVFAERGSERFILVDGHHRLEAAGRVGLKKFACKIMRGSKADALRFALGANADHGLRRSSGDKRKCVLMAMNQPEYEKYSARKLSELCNVSHSLVNDIKREINEAAEDLKQGKKRKDAKKKDRTRVTKEPPSQSEVDREEFLQAMSIVNTMPYADEELKKKLNLSQNDMEIIGKATQRLITMMDWELLS